MEDRASFVHPNNAAGIFYDHWNKFDQSKQANIVASNLICLSEKSFSREQVNRFDRLASLVKKQLIPLIQSVEQAQQFCVDIYAYVHENGKFTQFIDYQNFIKAINSLESTQSDNESTLDSIDDSDDADDADDDDADDEDDADDADDEVYDADVTVDQVSIADHSTAPSDSITDQSTAPSDSIAFTFSSEQPKVIVQQPKVIVQQPKVMLQTKRQRSPSPKNQEDTIQHTQKKGFMTQALEREKNLKMIHQLQQQIKALKQATKGKRACLADNKNRITFEEGGIWYRNILADDGSVKKKLIQRPDNYTWLDLKRITGQALEQRLKQAIRNQ